MNDSYKLYEYETDPLLSSTIDPVEQVDIHGHSSSSPPYNSSTKHLSPPNEYQIRWCHHNDHYQIECVPLHTKTQSQGPNNPNSHNNNKNNNTIFLRLSFYIRSLFHALRHIFYELLLPHQYPTSVRDGYLQYQMYDSLQGLCSYLRNIVCSAALFQAVVVMNQVNTEEEDGGGGGDHRDDVSSSSSSSSNNIRHTAWNAAIVWAIRDGTGLIGSLLYTYIISAYLDAYVKEFRFFADIINDIGFTFDMILPYIDENQSSNNSHSTLFWIVSSSSVLCKMMCGISAGATKSSITYHFALQGNMADLNAKESTQETMVTLIGMVGGIYMAKLLQSLENDSRTNHVSRYITWVFFLVLTLIHIYANYLGVSLLRLRTINTSRIDPCLQDLYQNNINISQLLQLTTKQQPMQSSQQLQYDTLRTLLCSTIRSPTQIREIMFLPVWRFFSILPSSCIYCNTIPYHRLQPYFHQSLLGQLFAEQATSSTADNQLGSKNTDGVSLNTTTTAIISSLRYNVTLMMKNNTTSTGIVKRSHRGTPKVAITLMTGATSNDELQAYLHAKLILILLPLESSTTATSSSSFQIRQVLLDSYDIIQLLFQQPLHQNENETNVSETTRPEPLIIDILQQTDWDVSRFYFNYPPTRCQLVLDTTTNEADEHVTSATNKKDD